MAFDIRNVGEDISQGVKKYPWLMGGGLVAVVGAFIYAQAKSSTSASEEATTTEPTYPLAATESGSSYDTSQDIIAALNSITTDVNESLTDMGDVVAKAITDNQTATTTALTEVATSREPVTDSPTYTVSDDYSFTSVEDAQSQWGSLDDAGKTAAHNYVVKEKQGSGEVYDSASGTWSKPAKSSSSTKNTVVSNNSGSSNNGTTSKLAATSGGKKVTYDNKTGVAKVGSNSYVADGKGGWKQVG